MKQSIHSQSILATIAVAAGFVVMGCGGAVPIGIDPVITSGLMTFDPDNSYNGDSSDFTDPEVTLAVDGTATTATFTKGNRTAIVMVPTDRPVLGQRFNLNASSAEMDYQESAGSWALGSGLVWFAGSEVGPALRWSGTLAPDNSQTAEGTADVSAIIGSTTIPMLSNSGTSAAIYSQTGTDEPVEFLTSDSHGSYSSTGQQSNIVLYVGDQRIIVRWNPSGNPGQLVGTSAEVEYNPDVNGSTGYIEATSGMVHLTYDNLSGEYTVSLVNVMITIDSVDYRYDGFITAQQAS